MQKICFLVDLLHFYHYFGRGKDKKTLFFLGFIVFCNA